MQVKVVTWYNDGLREIPDVNIADATVFLRNVLVILAKCVNHAEAKHFRDFTISLCTMDIVSYFPQHQFCTTVAQITSWWLEKFVNMAGSTVFHLNLN